MSLLSKANSFRYENDFFDLNIAKLLCENFSKNNIREMSIFALKLMACRKFIKIHLDDSKVSGGASENQEENKTQG